MRRPATFISSKRCWATRRAIPRASFLSTSSQTMSVRSHDPDTMLPFGRAATHRTCARRDVDEQSKAWFDWTQASHGVRVPGQRL